MGRSNGKRSVALLALLILSTDSAEAAKEFEKVGTIGAQFLKIGIGARASAMGSAFVAVADDPSALYWNPAGIARIEHRSLSFNHTNWFADIQLVHVGYLFHLPFAPGTFGLQARSLSMGRQTVRTVFRPDGDGTTFDAGDLSLGLSYGRSLTDKFSTGLSINFNQSTLATYSAGATSFDFGTLYDTGYRSLKIGMSIQNIGSEMVFIDDPVKLPTMFSVGMSMDLLNSGKQRLLGSGEFQHPPDNAERACAGFEYTTMNFVALRGGWYFRYDQERFAVGGGVKVPTGAWTGIKADYSYTENRDLPAVHRFSVDLSF